MGKCIMVGLDVHEETLVTQTAVDRGKPRQRNWKNTAAGRTAMWKHLCKLGGGAADARVIIVYEASSHGFILHDEALEEGFECHILAPTRLPSSPRSRAQKTDGKDALILLEVLRAHVLGGNDLPKIWVPDARTRDARELVRMRLSVGRDCTRVKTQVQTFIKRYRLRCPRETRGGWTSAFVAWLWSLCEAGGSLGPAARASLASLLRQYDWLQEERRRLDKAVAALAESARYAGPVAAVTAMTGVGLLTAMVVLTALGDLRRFNNRREIAAYLGLAPSSRESGAADARKGHITHQGPPRVRWALCQAGWPRVAHDPCERAFYRRLVRKNPKHKKIALVAVMRRLAIRMWHVGLEAQVRHGCFPEAFAM